MNLQRIEENIDEIRSRASFVFPIANSNQHNATLTLIDELLEDSVKNKP